MDFLKRREIFTFPFLKNLKIKTWTCSFEYYPILQFRIFLREDDLSVLQKIKEPLGIGTIYKKNMEYSRKKGINARDQHVYCITSLKELNKFKEILLNKKFHSKKGKDAELFFEILDLKNSKKHNTSEGNQKIVYLAIKMNSKNKNRRKHN